MFEDLFVYIYNMLYSVIHSGIFYVLCAIGGYFFYKNLIENVRVNGYYRYTNFMQEMGSYPNPARVRSGLVWTKFYTIKNKFSKTPKRCVYIDNFRIDNKTKYVAKILDWKVKQAEEFEVHFAPINFTKSNLVIGKMGAGKSQFYYVMIDQNWYNRAIIHDAKGDFTSIFYVENRDIIFNPYDTRSSIWNIWQETPTVVSMFFQDYLSAIKGGEKDFFTASAIDRFNQIFGKVYFNDTITDNKQKFFAFKQELSAYIENAKNGDQKSEKDVASTLELGLNIINLMIFRVFDGAKLFTLDEFFNKNGQAKLFLLNNPQYASELEPLFTGFISAFSAFHASKEETKTNLTLYLLDEYLTFVKSMNDTTKKRLHTVIRSKGGCLLPAIQYLPQDEELVKLLTSNNYAIICFASLENDTNNTIKKIVGEVEYEKISANGILNQNHIPKNQNTFQTNNQIELVKTQIIDNTQLATLAQKFEHITIVPEENVMYKGYTKPNPNLKETHQMFMAYDLKSFMKAKLKIQG